MTDLVLREKLEEFILYMYEILRGFPREEKFALTSQIKNCLLEIQRHIIRAQKSSSKKSHLYNADTALEELRALIRLAFELHYLGGKRRYEYISYRVNEIGKLLGGLIKSVP
jgi:four helix bundle protein